MSETATAALVRTPLYEVHRAAGAKLVPFAGYEMPLQYEGILAEHHRVRNHVALFDVSHMGEVRITGRDTLEAVNYLITNDIHRISDGRALYTALCADDGGIVDDIIVYRLSATEVFICLNASNRHKDVAHMKAHLRGEVTLVDESDSWAQIAVQGPNAPALLAKLFKDAGYSPKMKPFRLLSVPFEGVECYLATTGYTGEAGGEIYVPAQAAVPLWQSLMKAGGELGIAPAGLGCRDTLRLEMGYCLYGNDIDASTNPLEAGLGWVTRLEKSEFVGRDALRVAQEVGIKRHLVALEIFDRGIPRQGYAVYAGDAEVGYVTSGTLSPSTGRAIALAYVAAEHSALESELSVDCRGKHKPARVVKLPFYTKPA